MNPLVIIPTYNERENVIPLTEQLNALPGERDILFIDDNSPDGTGRILDEISRKHLNVRVMHRPGKEGIGAAHLAGLAQARQLGYATVITMDCDFTHNPDDIPRLMASAGDVVIGSRYLQPDSLQDWNWNRKLLTRLAHFLTRVILGMSYDCTGAYRLYRFDRLPKGIFELVESRSYPFFFESLYVLHRNGVRIEEIPISLPPRTYGNSKMPLTEPFRGVAHLLKVGLAGLLRPERYQCPAHRIEANASVHDEQGWDEYWKQTDTGGSLAYQTIASIYRRLVIARRFRSALENTFTEGARLLHAGCGSGQVDVAIQGKFRITAMDASLAALELYSRTVPMAGEVRHASIFQIPFPDQSFDGIYNLGVMEHFQAAEIVRILREFRRVLRPEGRLLLFWPHSKASSVAVLKCWHWIRQHVFHSDIRLHPDEVSLLPSRAWLKERLHEAGFHLTSYEFDARDFWVQAVIVAQPFSNPPPPIPSPGQ